MKTFPQNTMDEVKQKCTFKLLSSKNWCVSYQTSLDILKAQSAFFDALSMASPSDTLELHVDHREANAAKAILDVVALPPGTPLEVIMIYPQVNHAFIKKNASELALIWRFLHAWDLRLLTQVFKHTIHANLYDERAIIMDEIMKMEVIISPQREELFFSSCYGLGLARDIYTNWTFFQDMPDREKYWQRQSTPIWSSIATKLREDLTIPSGLTALDSKATHFRKLFPCFRSLDPITSSGKLLENEPPSDDDYVGHGSGVDRGDPW